MAGLSFGMFAGILKHSYRYPCPWQLSYSHPEFDYSNAVPKSFPNVFQMRSWLNAFHKCPTRLKNGRWKPVDEVCSQNDQFLSPFYQKLDEWVLKKIRFGSGQFVRIEWSWFDSIWSQNDQFLSPFNQKLDDRVPKTSIFGSWQIIRIEWSWFDSMWSQNDQFLSSFNQKLDKLVP